MIGDGSDEPWNYYVEPRPYGGTAPITHGPHEWGRMLGEVATQSCRHCPMMRCKPKTKAAGEADAARRFKEATGR